MVVRHQGMVWERSEKIDYPRHLTSEPHIALGVASSRIRFADPRGSPRAPRLVPNFRLTTSTVTRNTSEVAKSPVEHSKLEL